MYRNTLIDHPITLILGPTAVGKSEYALALARKTGAHIISGDAFQVYRGMDIGTAKISREARQEIPHYLMDICEPSDPYSVADFVKQANELCQRLKQDKIPIIICGGTGFYLYAFLNQFQFPEKSQDTRLREALMSEVETAGLGVLWERLMGIDPDYRGMISSQDTKRIVRALEVYAMTGEKPSYFQKKAVPRQDVTCIGLTMKKENLHIKIQNRVDTMIARGLIEEVHGLLDAGLDPKAQSLEALGYKESVAYLNGSLRREEMIHFIKLRTRQFAKRQMTWFRRFTDAHWIHVD